MNLEESNSFIEAAQKNDRRKKSVVISIIFCAILILILLALIFMIKQKDASTLKMFVDGSQKNITATLFKDVDGQTYVNVKEIAQLIGGYTYTKGEYGTYIDETTSCYLTNDYEIVAISSDLDTFVKYSEFTAAEPIIAEITVSVKSEKGQSQKYNLENPVKYIDNAIYVPFSALPDMFNAQVDLSEQNRIKIYTLNQIVLNGKNTIGQLGYTMMSNEYENLKAMVYGYAVVGNDSFYGVINLYAPEDNREVIGLKYDDITFIPNLKDFLTKATVDKGTVVGVFSSDGSTVITPKEYDEISIYDDETQLYLVSNDNKYGILNRKGEVIVYADYDAIGYESAKNLDLPAGTGSYKVLFNECVVVKDGSKYGLFDIEGNELLSTVYTSFMFDTSRSDSLNVGAKSVFLIPETVGIKGIVISQNDLYGIYDVEAGAIIIPTVCSKVYSITKEAKTTYYLEYNGMTLELEQYLKDNNLVSVKSSKTEETSSELVENVSGATSEGNESEETTSGETETSEVVTTE